MVFSMFYCYNKTRRNIHDPINMEETMIDKSEYPKNQEWNAKLFSVPEIPRGEKGQLHTLKMMMQAVRDGLPAQTILKISTVLSTGAEKNR